MAEYEIPGVLCQLPDDPFIVFTDSETGKMFIVNNKRILTAIIVTLIFVFGFISYKFGHYRIRTKDNRHVIDKTGLIPVQDLPRFEQYMGWIMRESGVDIRFVFFQDTEGHSIERLAAELMDQMNIGRTTGSERGVLILYDMGAKRLKIEVGYGLEEWFPDSFISYLVQNHARMFFTSGDLSLGLRMMLRLLQQRIRDAVIGNQFDPRVLDRIQSLTHLSGGAGVTETVVSNNESVKIKKSDGSDHKENLTANSPEEAYRIYLKWLINWPSNNQSGIFTPDTRRYLSAFPMSSAYADLILMTEYGKSYRIVRKNNLAILYFTGTPFVSPHFFVLKDGQWYMDMMTEIRNTHECVGGVYTWTYTGVKDNYTSAFRDLLISVKGYWRFKDGDNRPLVIRGRY